MALDLAKGKGRKTKRRVYALHHHVVMHPLWAQMSPYAKVLWLEFGLEYNTVNNGWLACPYNYLLKERGFKSRTTISESLSELLWYDFLEQTYPGSIREAARYALTHLDIDQHKDNYVTARKAPHTYKNHSGEVFVKRIRKKSDSPHGDIIGTPSVPKTDNFRSDKYANRTKGKKVNE